MAVTECPIIDVPHANHGQFPVCLLACFHQEGVILLGIPKSNALKSQPLLPDSFHSLIYTYDDLMKEGEWLQAGNITVKSAERYSERSIAGRIMLGGSKLPSKSHQSVPEQRIAGISIATDYIAYLNGHGEGCKFFRINSRAMESFLAYLSTVV